MKHIIIDITLPIQREHLADLERMANEVGDIHISVIEPTELSDKIVAIAEKDTKPTMIYFRLLPALEAQSKLSSDNQSIASLIDDIQVIDIINPDTPTLDSVESFVYPVIGIYDQSLSTTALSRAVAVLPEITIMQNLDHWREFYRQLFQNGISAFSYVEWLSIGQKYAVNFSSTAWKTFISKQKEGSCTVDELRTDELNEPAGLKPYQKNWDGPPFPNLQLLLNSRWEPNEILDTWVNDLYQDLLTVPNDPDWIIHIQTLFENGIKHELKVYVNTIRNTWDKLRTNKFQLWPLKDVTLKAINSISSEIKTNVGAFENEDKESINIRNHNRLSEDVLKLKSIIDLYKIWKDRRGRIIKILLTAGSITGCIIPLLFGWFELVPVLIGLIAGATCGYLCFNWYEKKILNNYHQKWEAVKSSLKETWKNAINQESTIIIRRLEELIFRQIRNRIKGALVKALTNCHESFKSFANNIESIYNSKDSPVGLADPIRQKVIENDRKIDTNLSDIDEIVKQINKNCFAGFTIPDIGESELDNVNFAFHTLVSQYRRKVYVPLDKTNENVNMSLSLSNLRDLALWPQKFTKENNLYELFIPAESEDVIPNHITNQCNRFVSHAYKDTLLAISIFPLEH